MSQLPSPDEARRGVDVFPLVVACKTTAAVEVIFMDGTKTKNVILGLLQLEAKFNEIKKICCDIKSAFKTPRNNALPLLSFQEAQLAFSTICRRINDIPYKSKYNRNLVSPATFVHPSMSFRNLDLSNCEHKFQDFNTSAVKIQKHLDLATKIRNDLICDPSLYKEVYLKGTKRKARTLKASINDIVLINPKGKYNTGRFGIIERFSSKQTAIVRTKHGEEKVAVINLFVILSEELCLKNKISFEI